MTDGKKRVIIENVQPVVDGGIYPAKRTVGERVDVTASIFGDGHDHIRASVFHKKELDGPWTETPMSPTFNDAWTASFYVVEKGNYFFTIHAWIDHLDTWYDGFKKKANAKVDVKVELMEGAAMLRKLGEKKTSLLVLAKKLEDKRHYAESIELILGKDFSKVVQENPLKEIYTSLDVEYPVMVERVKANFSSWY